jgi:hypothetical protein
VPIIYLPTTRKMGDDEHLNLTPNHKTYLYSHQKQNRRLKLVSYKKNFFFQRALNLMGTNKSPAGREKYILMTFRQGTHSARLYVVFLLRKHRLYLDITMAIFQIFLLPKNAGHLTSA